MKIVVLTGSHPRHYYVVNELATTGFVVGHVIEKREEFMPSPPTHLSHQDRLNFIRHFEGRAKSEAHHFEGHDRINTQIATYETTKETLNDAATINWVVQQQPDLVISYGVHKLSSDFLKTLSCPALNIHGGLSPWFRGNITLFWPFYMLKPNWAGMTVHVLTEQLDGGDILHHSVPQLHYGDGVHDVASKAVKQVAKDLKYIIRHIPMQEWKYIPQQHNGKLFVSTDWTPQHLRLIYNEFNDDIVDAYLNDELTESKPSLVRAFEKDE